MKHTQAYTIILNNVRFRYLKKRNKLKSIECADPSIHYTEPGPNRNYIYFRCWNSQFEMKNWWSFWWNSHFSLQSKILICSITALSYLQNDIFTFWIQKKHQFSSHFMLKIAKMYNVHSIQCKQWKTHTWFINVTETWLAETKHWFRATKKDKQLTQ